MFKKINYQRDLKNLTKSIIIKLDSIGYQIQHYLYKNKGYSKPDRILDNKREWKYYINLSGKYHSSETEMYLYNRYTDEDMLLTVENINMYPELRNELMLLGDSFNDLVKKYPHQESLIKSILFPVDIEKAISAENGTILTYNKNLVDRKEYSLIPRLQDYIYGYFARWYNSPIAVVRYKSSTKIYCSIYHLAK
jgi:phage pi2 protein 07